LKVTIITLKIKLVRHYIFILLLCKQHLEYILFSVRASTYDIILCMNLLFFFKFTILDKQSLFWNIPLQLSSNVFCTTENIFSKSVSLVNNRIMYIILLYVFFNIAIRYCPVPKIDTTLHQIYQLIISIFSIYFQYCIQKKYCKLYKKKNNF